MATSKTNVRKGAGRPVGSSGDVTRARILDAARESFGSKGFGPTTNKDVAGLAGITPAAIYRYFPSKVALYVATVDRAMEELEPPLRRAAEDAEPGRGELVALARGAGRLHEERPYLAAFLSSLPVEMQRHPEIAEAMTAEPDPVSTLVASAVERAKERGELRADATPEHVVSMIIACNIGLSLWASAIVPEPSSDAMDAFAELLAGALFAAPDARVG